MTNGEPGGSLDLGKWIKPPSKHVGLYWVLESKFTESYALMYYSSMPGIDMGANEEGNPEGTIVESIGDVLYMKIQHSEVVDVEADEVESVVTLVVDLFG